MVYSSPSNKPSLSIDTNPNQTSSNKPSLSIDTNPNQTGNEGLDTEGK
jgi:hypothetical protein